jgi:voltage-gated potassium channel
MRKHQDTPEKRLLDEQRQEFVGRLESWLEPAMALLGVAWLVLVIIDMIRGLSGFLLLVNYFIWAIFILDFLIRFSLAPHKAGYLRRNWLTALSLALPALRVFRAFQAFRVLRLARVARTTRLLKIIGSMNRGLGVLSRTLNRRGLGYVLVLTFLFTFVGAAGMYSFEKDAPSGGFKDYGDALWWTSMTMTTMGSQYWPETAEGRLLCLLLATYAFAMFGYVTATIASFFIGLDKEREASKE